MIVQKEFAYQPSDNERERASNGYLMSLLAVIVGLPLPIVNLIATFIFFLSSRKSTYFVRWHTLQALLSQASLFLVNSVGVYWSLNIAFGTSEASNLYIGYIITIVLLNFGEFVASMYLAINVRKGQHLALWFYGDLTDQICIK
ncbi:MAG: hypothetical protein ACPGJS_21285 [Flammeovirgaceae bacterium]